MNEYNEYQIIEMEGDEGEIYEFAVTDFFEFEDRKFAVLTLVEGDELTGAYEIYEAVVDDENQEIELKELDPEEEEMLSNLYYEELAASDEEFIEDSEEE